MAAAEWSFNLLINSASSRSRCRSREGGGGGGDRAAGERGGGGGRGGRGKLAGALPDVRGLARSAGEAPQGEQRGTYSPGLRRHPPAERLNRKWLLSARSPEGSCRHQGGPGLSPPQALPWGRVTGQGEGPHWGKPPRSLTLQHGATPTTALSSVRAVGRRGGGP